ncbi:excalibur calcium-binding domain-containing protein [Nocardia sp. NPDC051463]|uniref:excalibur calcium-binding domain-containing protein n=1 Tax=Nocardia sp. NPDC051463 TaxID=3154845 RepID=UPI00343E2815
MAITRRHAVVLIAFVAVTPAASACGTQATSPPSTNARLTTSTAPATRATPTPTATISVTTASVIPTTPATPPGIIAPVPPVAAPAPAAPPATALGPTTPAPPSVYYPNCAAARAAGAAPLRRGEPGYSSKLDRDNDGVACE